MYARVFSNHYILLLLQKCKQFIAIYSISSFHTPPSMLSSSHHHAPFITRFLYVKAKRRLPYSQGRCFRGLSRWISILRKCTTALTSCTIGRLPCWPGKILYTKRPPSLAAPITKSTSHRVVHLYINPTRKRFMWPDHNVGPNASNVFSHEAKQRYPKNQIQSPL